MNLTGEQYWKWRTFIAELWNSESKEMAAKHELHSMNLKTQVASLQAQVFDLKTMKARNSSVETAREEYNAYKKQLEEVLGVSLSGATIDDVTFEIRFLGEK